MGATEWAMWANEQGVIASVGEPHIVSCCFILMIDKFTDDFL